MRQNQHSAATDTRPSPPPRHLWKTIPARQRHPDWLKVPLPGGDNFFEIKGMLRELKLHTVCEEARCPNIGECFGNRTATFMILGRICTRACSFCAVTTGHPTELDLAEPEHVADAVEKLGLRHVVVTSVARDDLADGGASIFAQTIAAIRRRMPATGVEVLIPDFLGNWDHLGIVVQAKPDILNHNLETVERLTPIVRSKATYRRSLELLAEARRQDDSLVTKSGIMVGLGETREEISQALRDLRDSGVMVLTVGQYLRPSLQHIPLVRHYHPDEFQDIKEEALSLGFAHVESGPLVRSSYHAHEQVDAYKLAQRSAGPA